MFTSLHFLSNIFTFQPPDALFIETFAERVPVFTIIAASILFLILVTVILTLYRSRSFFKKKVEEQQANLEIYRTRLDKIESLANMDTAEREFETINRLILAIQHRDIETANHIVRMAHYSRLIAKHVYPPDSPMVGLIFLAAPMHDVGKIGISDKILGKHQRLDHFEYDEIKRHALIGHDILKGSTSQVIRLGAVIARTHHERYDGLGYPHGLKKDEIPMAGRIVALADYFDALVSNRVYKKAWPLERALEEIRKASGKRFDTVCVEAFFKALDAILKIKDQYRESVNGEQ